MLRRLEGERAGVVTKAQAEYARYDLDEIMKNIRFEERFPPAEPEPTPRQQRDGLAELKAAALRRRQQQEGAS